MDTKNNKLGHPNKLLAQLLMYPFREPLTVALYDVEIHIYWCFWQAFPARR